MKTRQIGGRTVSSIGLGGMPVSIDGRPDYLKKTGARRPESLRDSVRAAEVRA